MSSGARKKGAEKSRMLYACNAGGNRAEEKNAGSCPEKNHTQALARKRAVAYSAEKDYTENRSAG
jgi:hypothetical protein